MIGLNGSGGAEQALAGVYERLDVCDAGRGWWWRCRRRGPGGPGGGGGLRLLPPRRRGSPGPAATATWPGSRPAGQANRIRRLRGCLGGDGSEGRQEGSSEETAERLSKSSEQQAGVQGAQDALFLQARERSVSA